MSPSSIIELYISTIKETGSAFGRSAFSLLYLLFAGGVIVFVGPLVGGMGFAGGFIMALLIDFLVGWYLAQLEVVIGGRKRLTFDDIRSLPGTYFIDVLQIGFLFGVPRMLLELSNSQLAIVYAVGIALLFNPIPEFVYQDRRDFLGMVRGAVEFMQENWPEWLAGHILVGAVWIGLIGALLGSWNTQLAVTVVELYGPWFGFIGLPVMSLNLLQAGPVGLALALALLLGNHALMVFRGVLFSKLSGSSRRSRAWQARMK